MCGIAGVFRFDAPGDDETVVRAMLRRIARRGPDDEGVVRDGRLTAGNRRLAILDVSAAGHQPMRSADGRWLVTFNGEIYNFDELREELGLGAGQLASRTDTEVLLRAWAKWGEAALDRFVGQWAFALFDRVEQRLWLARDRFGEKPLFLHRGAAALVFASSLPAVLAAPWVPRELDPDALAEYVTLRYVVAPRTVLAGVEKLPPGHLLEAAPRGVELRRWWAPRFTWRARAGPPRQAEAVEEFGALLHRATRRCLVSDVPVALLLSDGIDSQSIHAVLRHAGREVPTCTYRMVESPSNLAPLGVDGRGAHDLLVSAAERVRDMAPAFASLTEPVGDGAALATWLLIRNARRHATVFLCGHGGDEVLGGYRLSQDRFRLAALRRLAAVAPSAWLRPTLERFLYGAEPLSTRRAALLAARADHVPAAARYLIQRPLPSADVARVFLPGSTPGKYLGTVDALYASCAGDAADLDRMQGVMLATFLSSNILSFADSVAMDSSAELRMPFLDRDLATFVLSLPPRLRVSRWPGRANTKTVLRLWGRTALPAGVVTRRKKTFAFGNLPALLRSHGNELRGYVLGSSALRRALPGAEGWLAAPPEAFHGPWEGTLWALLALGIWCEHAEVRA
jgi:asparagine synthase (glutamine-hydrolysing)